MIQLQGILDGGDFYEELEDDNRVKRLFLIRVEKGSKQDVVEILKNLFPTDDVLVSEGKDILLLKYLDKKEKSFTQMIRDTVEGESYCTIQISVSLPFIEWKELFEAGSQVRTALEIGHFFMKNSKILNTKI
ncbi:hypothetical protein P261_01032 [Lachnospiraceae bacterium TWA4]|nr:hypothetical protein P261_01032 [Lachnospiraceae bacterium TWA4]